MYEYDVSVTAETPMPNAALAAECVKDLLNSCMLLEQLMEGANFSRAREFLDDLQDRLIDFADDELRLDVSVQTAEKE